ncbi:hypothetical protein RND71_031899 [Anisodus tanguticus]|uniref:SNRNP25 ubiquitin-like domain-containing protein n=1 Tax=Anisodus tanguticus TaxID=243964 RepID=A0AAE1RD89_9SOLA|nr:hypothetical protein RND71_031899 [Anisodus tanguticus]
MQTSEIMKEEEEEDVSPKVSLKKNGSFICVATPLFLYDKLPEEPLKLTILKLDGSSFDIEVARNGSVEDLKWTVIEAFSHCKISWLHVWGHFCLSYCGTKLLSDDDLIGTYGIKDGDEGLPETAALPTKAEVRSVDILPSPDPTLWDFTGEILVHMNSPNKKKRWENEEVKMLSFVRHVSVGYNPEKTQSEGEDHQFNEPRASTGFDDEEMKGEEEDNDQQDDSENEDINSEDENNGGGLGSCHYRSFHLFRGLFSYQKLANSERRVEEKTE